ncbi:MAG: DUF4238 domain-containing protein [Lachnospiraceae bacterium]|nr:DUF4238 domain-containing protein [Lachnospiraceae bacterium]
MQTNQQEAINQHYVPQFCFELFFPENKFCYLSVPRTTDERIIFSHKANKKSQSSEDYFYGKNQMLENEYAKLENDTSNLIRNFLTNEELLNEEQFNLLCAFVFSQAIRTKGFLNRFIEIKQEFAKQIGARLVYNKEKILFGFYDVATAYSPILSLGLNCSFIENHTNCELLFSDNPVQLVNAFFPPACGLGMAGLVIVFPICSKGFVLIYDEKMFNLNNLQMTENDINEYNKLLIANCHEKIYFQNSCSQQYFKELITGTLDCRSRAHYHTLGNESKVVILNFPQINTRPEFSFLSLKKPYSDLAFKEKTQFPRFRSDEWKSRFNINSKILAATGLSKYDWSKMNEIVDLYWGQQGEILSIIINKFKSDIDTQEAIEFLFFGTEIMQITKKK